MAIPICVPSLEPRNEPVRVGTWLVDIGQHVESGDRIVELELTGMVYVVSAESSGRIVSIEQQRGCSVEKGEILAWLDTSEET
jgi:biotin carboxyl carrier protein